MNKEDFGELIASLEEVSAFHRGEHPDPARVVIHPPKPVDIPVLRQRLGLSQSQFAAAFGVSVSTLQNWEQKRRFPDGPARVLLTIIDREPEAVVRALHLGRVA